MIAELKECKDDALKLLKEMQEEEALIDKTLRKMGENELRDYLNRFINSGKVFIAIEDGEIVGILLCMLKSWKKYTILDRILYIDAIFVKKEFRGKGIGAKLIERAIKYAKERGAKAIILDVHSKNYRAVEFYKKIGFQDYYLKMILPL